MKPLVCFALLCLVVVRVVQADPYRAVPVGNAESQFMQRQLALEARQQVLEKRLQHLQSKQRHTDDDSGYDASAEDSLHRMHPRHIEIRKSTAPVMVQPPALPYPITPVIPFYPPVK